MREAVGRGADLASELRAAADAYGLVDRDGEDLLARLVYDVVGDPAEAATRGRTWPPRRCPTGRCRSGALSARSGPTPPGISPTTRGPR